MKLTGFSRGYWEISVQCNASNEVILKHYDVLKDREKGMTMGQIAIKYNISRQHVLYIINKYK